MIGEFLDLCRPLHDRQQKNGNPVRSGGRLIGGISQEACDSPQAGCP
jgi:hypothetical protein